MSARPEASASESVAAARSSARRRAFSAFSFPKEARLARRAQFEALYASGAKRAGRYVVVYGAGAPEGVSGHRLGVTAAKRTFHDAHERNRAKRLMRECFRLLRPSIPPPVRDFVFVARRPILGAGLAQVRADVARSLRLGPQAAVPGATTEAAR